MRGRAVCGAHATCACVRVCVRAWPQDNAQVVQATLGGAATSFSNIYVTVWSGAAVAAQSLVAHQRARRATHSF